MQEGSMEEKGPDKFLQRLHSGQKTPPSIDKASADGSKGGRSDGIEDGSSHGAKLSIGEGSGGSVEDGKLLFFKLGINGGGQDGCKDSCRDSIKGGSLTL
jgi:hypothetical protein